MSEPWYEQYKVAGWLPEGQYGDVRVRRKVYAPDDVLLANMWRRRGVLY